jgi:hypothetical protein
MSPRRYYHPVPRGLEQRIADRLDELRKKNARHARTTDND